MIFVIELAQWFESPKEMMFGVLSECYARKERGEYFRTKSFFAAASSGENTKIIVRFDGKRLSGVETSTHNRQLPNWLFPYMLTDEQNKLSFFHTREEMLKSLKNGKEYKLTMTSESLLNKNGEMGFFNIKKDGDILIVNGKKHNL